MKERCYRVEQVANGRRCVVFEWNYAPISMIRKSMEHNTKMGGIIEIYTRTGKRVLESFEG